jgi:hypothetical protein
MTVSTNPKLSVNRFPWNRPTSTARMTLETFLSVAHRRIDEHPGRLAFDAGQGRLVLAWLKALLDRAPGQMDED